MSLPIDGLSPKDYILIKGARLHNLKNLDVAIPRGAMVVVTGVSGSGKSSLVFDTLYAEGQRRYVESLSSYARQFLERMKKPEVDFIKGLAPAMAIEQKVTFGHPRSTVGTVTEVYDYLKLLFARGAHTFSPISGEKVTKDTIDSTFDFLESLENNSRVEVLSPLIPISGKDHETLLGLLQQKGFSRLKFQNNNIDIQELIDNQQVPESLDQWFLLIDRFTIQKDEEDFASRAMDSIAQGFEEGHGDIIIRTQDTDFAFNNRFERDGMAFEEPSVNLFTFGNPFGACKTCEGFGSIIGVDENLVVPDSNKSIFEGAIAPWKGEIMKEWLELFIESTKKWDFPIHRPYNELSEELKSELWNGNKYFPGVHRFFKFLEENAYKIQYRVMLSRYRGRTVCTECGGTRLRGDAQYVQLEDIKTGDRKSIKDLVLMTIDQLLVYLEKIHLSESDQSISERLFIEIKQRLRFLSDVGLGYLTLNRPANTLSGGESQRIRLATSLGSNLVGSMYILDEPSIGLHPRDTHRLIDVLKNLRDKGNTVVIVEHEQLVMEAADRIFDIGPEAGTLGGHLVFEGTYDELVQSASSLTGKYLRGELSIETPDSPREWNRSFTLEGANEHNLKNIDITIPLHALTVVTGVSGSGKTTLIKKILYPALKKMFGGTSEATGKFRKLSGDYKRLTDVEMIDQNPIGKSSRSNPVTYTKAYDYIRNLFSDQPMSVARGYKPKHFSFNVEGGRCETCQGEGKVTIEMQFLADIIVECDECQGKRFKQEILDITYKEKNISDVLEMTIDEAVSFFEGEKSLMTRLKPLQEVGLGYVQLGQSSSTLSGGEAQRIKLAYYLIKGNGAENMLFIFDEPTTGLHFHDIQKLMKSIQALINQGNTVIIIEHNVEVIRCADWLIDLGPEGGEDGGHLVYQGIPSEIKNIKESYTGQYL
jgi:excinuclease ABC subunit A